MSVTTLLQQIKSRDFGHANETFRAIVEQRIAARLAQERTTIGEAFDRDPDDPRLQTYGFDKNKRVIFATHGKLSLADVREVVPKVVRVETHGSKNWFGDVDQGYSVFSIDSYGEAARSQKNLIARLARLGIPAKPAHTPYEGHVGVQVPIKYERKTNLELFGSSY